MNEQERLIHAVAFETVQSIEKAVAFPREKRASMFFAVYVCIKRSLERLSADTQTGAAAPRS